MKHTKMIFAVGAWALVAAACTVGDATSFETEENVDATSSALRCTDCPGEEIGGTELPAPASQPRPSTPQPEWQLKPGWEQKLPLPEFLPKGDDTCRTPACKNLAEMRELAEKTLYNEAFRCDEITGRQCELEREYAREAGAATDRATDYLRIHDAYPVFNSNGHVWAICRCGCFESSTSLLAVNEDGTTEWKPANAIGSTDQLMSLREDASLSSPELAPRPIDARTRGPERPALYVFVLSNGRSLKVTQHHGMVLDDGRVVAATDVPVGSRFVATDGSLVEVLAIEHEVTSDDVYNFEVRAAENQGHILAAEGVLVGDLAWQNRLKAELGAIHVRR